MYPSDHIETMKNKRPHVMTSRAPLVTVIVPIYNVADYVVGCINSLKAQSLTDFEALVIDDGSTDGSGAIARAEMGSDHRFKLIKQDNRGLSGARNTGLDAARGKCIAFLDGDDRFTPDFLARMHNALVKGREDWVACAMRSCFADGTSQVHSAIHGAAAVSAGTALRRYPLDSWTQVIPHFPSAWNKLYRYDLIGDLRFDEGTWFEDHGFFLQVAARCGSLPHLPEPLYLQTRDRPGQITASDDDRVFEQFDVLRQMRVRMQPDVKTEPDTAFSRIASRLISERSTALRDPARRTRFATEAANFLRTEELNYDIGWDDDLPQLWEIEMAGELPLSVILPWDGIAPEALATTLQSLAATQGPGCEILLITPQSASEQARTLAASCPGVTIKQSQTRALGKCLSQGLRAARGRYVIFLRPGDLVHPWALMSGCETLYRHGAQTGIAPFRRGTGRLAPIHHGFENTDVLPRRAGPVQLTAQTALGLSPELSARIFERDFLTELPLSFTDGPQPDWALCLAAPLMAPCTVYLGWAGVQVDTELNGARARALPRRSSALSRGHDTMLQALPPQVTEDLPQGWKRRLFARALRAQIDAQRAPPTLLAGAALAALARGYTGPQVEEAGFDTAFGPRLGRLLNPKGALGGPALLPRAAPLASRQQGGDKPNHTEAVLQGDGIMYAFPLKTAGLFRFRADFHDHDYANLSFLAEGGQHIPFHLSLRLPEGLIVANDSRVDGAWRAERPIPYSLDREGVEVTIEILPPCLRVLVEGRTIFAMGRRSFMNRSGLSGLEKISFLELTGGIRPLDIMPQMPSDTLTLDPRLQLRVTGTAIDMRIAHSGEQLIATPAPAPSGVAALVADLTGRHWQGLAPEAPLVISDGSGTALLQVTRAEMSARITEIMRHPPEPTDAALALSCLDHLRHAELHDSLPTTTLEALYALAAAYGLEKQIAPRGGAIRLPLTTDLETSQTDARIEAVLTRLHHHRETLPGCDPFHLLHEANLSASEEDKLFLSLAEIFCREGEDFEGLFTHAQKTGVLDRLLAAPEPENAWARSAMLPYLVRAGLSGKAAGILWRGLDAPQTGWMLTPPLAWTLRHLIGTPHQTEPQRQDLLYAVMRNVEAIATDYWSHVPCRELTAAAADLLLHHRRSDYLKRDITAFCLRVYGLSRIFWDQVEEGLPEDRVLSPRVSLAQNAFATLRAADATPAAIDGALTLFEREGAIEAPRIRRELLGPAGLSEPLTFAALSRAHGNPAEAALRHMAAPGTAPMGLELHNFLASTIPDFSPETPRAPFFDLQIDCARRLRVILKAPNRTEGLAHLLDDLAKIAQSDSGFLGLGLGMILLRRLENADARQVSEWLRSCWESMSSNDRALSARAPALRGPWARLIQGDSPEIDTVIKDFSPHLTGLPTRGENHAELATGSALFDTLVVVFSCTPYLDTRIPALRKGWLTLLKALDIPYVIVVGAGDGRREGDIVHLDAADDYEGLPEKTLAAIRWVHDNTDYAHMLKIDDDCFLNAPLFFESLSYRKFDYYGRKLTRIVGQMDRAWHQEKSTSSRGRQEFDRSSEPSTYADGGCGYTLSRRAMAAALTAAARPSGQRLMALSFMEDKLLGDLLALEGIRVAEEDYRVTIRRRTFDKATPVSIWRNSFFPSRVAPLQLIHLDNHQDQEIALAQLDSDTLHPPKVWPSFQEARLGYMSNALELLSDADSVGRARTAEVAVVAVIRNEMFMLPHFLAHYRALGVSSFLIADNLSDDGSREYLLEQPDVALFSVDTDYRESQYGVAWQQALMAQFRPGKWSLVADADELLVWQRDQHQTLPELLSTPDFAQAEAVRIFMLDMYPQGPLESATFASGDPFTEAGFCDQVPFLNNTPARGPYLNAPTWTSGLRHRLLPGSQATLFVAQKLALLRYSPFMRLAAGLHFVSDARLATRELVFGHFKYNAAFREKAANEVARKQHWGDAAEYRKYLALASEGRSVIYDSEVSVPWYEAPFVSERLD